MKKTDKTQMTWTGFNSIGKIYIYNICLLTPYALMKPDKRALELEIHCDDRP